MKSAASNTKRAASKTKSERCSTKRTACSAEARRQRTSASRPRRTESRPTQEPSYRKMRDPVQREAGAVLHSRRRVQGEGRSTLVSRIASRTKAGPCYTEARRLTRRASRARQSARRPKRGTVRPRRSARRPTPKGPRLVLGPFPIRGAWPGDFLLPNLSGDRPFKGREDMDCTLFAAGKTVT